MKTVNGALTNMGVVMLQNKTKEKLKNKILSYSDWYKMLIVNEHYSRTDASVYVGYVEHVTNLEKCELSPMFNLINMDSKYYCLKHGDSYARNCEIDTILLECIDNIVDELCSVGIDEFSSERDLLKELIVW